MNDSTEDLLEAVQAYLGCAEWASIHTQEDGETVELDSLNAKWHHKAKAMAREAVSEFYHKAGYLLGDWEPGQVGHSLFLSRNGHGAGFFDFPKMNGKELQDLAMAMGSQDAILGDDGQLHLE